MSETTLNSGEAEGVAQVGGDTNVRIAADTSAPISRGERVRVIDVLRGFALFGILAVNMAAFRGPVFGEAGAAVSLPDRAATFLVAFLFEQKFYVLFSFLFGYGLSVQMARAAARGARFAPRFLRRLLGLFLIGLAHALLLYTCDILVTYALLGVVLLLFRNAPDRFLLLAATSLVALSALAFALGGVVFSSGAPVARADLLADARQSVEAYRGTPVEVVAQRFREYPGTLGFALAGQGPTALAMFFVGLWAGRRRLFERLDRYRTALIQTLKIGLAVGGTGALIWAIQHTVSGFSFDAPFFLASAADFATAPFLSAVYLASIALLYGMPGWRRILESLAPVGRMALSNYLLQSLVAAFVFTGYGLGLYGKVGAAAGLGLSLVIFGVQIPLSAWWLSRFDFGPAEWALRSFTYGRLQTLRFSTSRKKPAPGPSSPNVP